MTDDAIDPQLGELEQQDIPFPPVIVEPRGPVQTHELPARHGTSKTINVSNVADNAETLGGEDLRRKWIKILCTGQAVRIGFSKKDVASSDTSGVLPINTILTLETSEAVWVCSTNAAGSVVSYWTGSWAD